MTAGASSTNIALQADLPAETGAQKSLAHDGEVEMFTRADSVPDLLLDVRHEIEQYNKIGADPLTDTAGNFIARCPACCSTRRTVRVKQDAHGFFLPECENKCSPVAINEALGAMLVDLARLPEVTRPTITCASTLQHQEFKPLRFVVPSILPEGLSLFSGASKIGKTSLLCYMGARIALGRPVFTYSAERAGVLLLLLEDPLRRIRARFADILGDEPWPDNLHVVDMFSKFPKIGAGAEDAITDTLERNPDIRFVGVDILNRLMSERRPGASVYASDVWLFRNHRG